MFSCGVVCGDVRVAGSFALAVFAVALALFVASWLIERRPWRKRRGYVKRAWLAGEWQLWLWDEVAGVFVLAWRERIAGGKERRRKLAATAELMRVLIDRGEFVAADLVAVEPFEEEELVA